ncbi:MAG: hypothetical protein K6T66_08395 [Peptococcaceae bacterium]|nr:hypothetical protein [Peptococcaceae bacterium]
MLTGIEINEVKPRSEGLEIWTCGCTVVGSVTSINVRCISCGNVFKKVGKKNKMQVQKKGKIESVKIELVNNIQTLFSEAGQPAPCERCGDSGEIKVFTQEWDRIKSHMSPCPVCRSQEWLDWSAGRRLVGEK